MRLIRLLLVIAVTLLLLLNDECKLESLQEDGSRTRQEIPQTACYKLESVIVVRRICLMFPLLPAFLFLAHTQTVIF